MKSCYPFFSNLPIVAIGPLLALLANSCSERNAFVPPPPPRVETVQPTVGDVTIFIEFPGRTDAFSKAEIRARVKGFLKSRDFEPGKFVKEGDLLFQIEPEEFEAAVLAAEGQLKAAQANEGIADTNLARRKQASQSGAVSKIDVESAEAEAKAATAQVEVAQAALADAKRALKYTQVTSPIGGRVSNSFVDVGNLVGADGPTLLTAVVQDDPIYVNFEGNERDALDNLQNRPKEGRPDYTADFKEIKMRLTLSDGRVYEKTGNMNFIDNQIDPATGTIKARAEFPNPEGALASGLFVRIGMPETIENAITIPAAALQRDLGGDFVVVVGEGDVAQRRPVKPTRFQVDGNAVIASGLTAEDRVIVSNLQRARPGLPVQPVASQPGEAQATSATQAAETTPEPEA
ncbi:MAG: efflux RND transporter periplasmic adaptor subunit [Verrucomicrobiae bacterium]|nr:efflux RND transporter periplasmic adaptor subunit [Verrucomicrobiae bacterium]